MLRVISLIVPMAVLILAAACANSDNPTPTATATVLVTLTEDISAFSDDECQTNDNVTSQATWAYLRETTTVEDMYQLVDATIHGKVVRCSPGRVVISSSGRFTHFTNVHIQILEDWSKEALPVNELIVSMGGGESTPYFIEAPPFSLISDPIPSLDLRRS